MPYVDYRKPSARRTTAARPPLAQFVLLSMLFHMLAILMFGAPSGGSREGRAMWGSLQVVLQGAAPEPPPPLKLDRGMLRTPPKAPRAPGAGSASAPAAAPPPPVDVPDAFPKLLDRIVIPDLNPEKLPSLRVPPPTETPYVPRPLPERTPAAEPVEAARVPQPPAPLAPLPAPAAITPPVERPPVETAVIPVPVTPPVERPAVEAPIVPVPATPSVARPPVESAVVPVPAPPPVERPPLEVPALPVPPTQSVTPPRIEAPSVTPEKPAPSEVAPAPAPPPPVERVAPRAPEREVPRKVEPEVPMSAPSAPRDLPLRAPSSPGVPRDPRETAPSTSYDPTAAPLSVDLDVIRKRAGQIAREGWGNRALLPFPMPPPPERKTKEQIAIEKARKPDCRTAYKDLGLLAIAPLIANEFGEGTCRW